MTEYNQNPELPKTSEHYPGRPELTAREQIVAALWDAPSFYSGIDLLLEKHKVLIEKSRNEVLTPDEDMMLHEIGNALISFQKTVEIYDPED